MDKIDFEAHIATKAHAEAMIKNNIPSPVPQKKGTGAPSLENRIEEMNRYGIQTQIISGGGELEKLDRETAIYVAQKTNDEIYEATQKYPSRFLGYATLIPQDVEASLRELDRCKYELNFPAWNTSTNFTDSYIDEDQYFPLLQRAEELGMFVYLHPAMPSLPRLNGLGPMLSKGLGFHVDACITMVRLVCKGVFDRLPALNMFMGHMGESLPFMLDRIDSMNDQGAVHTSDSQGYNKHPLSFYFEHNIWITTSGNFSAPAFRCAKERLGIDHICLGSDFPIKRYGQTFSFLDSLHLTQEEQEKLFYKNAMRFLQNGHSDSVSKTT